jgi:hypothetical protein
MVAMTRASLNESRAKFAERTGLSMTKIANIEKGRSPTAEEWALLEPHVTAAYPTVDVGEEVSVGSPSASADPSPASSPAPALVGTAQSEEPASAFTYAGTSFSNSECRCFKRCHRKWWLAYYRALGIREPDATGPMSVGNRIHEAFALWFRPTDSVNPYETLAAGFTRDLERWPDQTKELLQEQELCSAMVEGFFQWMAENGTDQGITIVGTEETLEFPIPLTTGVQVNIRGRLDVRVQRQIDGAQLFRDWKTVASLSEPVRTLHMDEQMLWYHLLEYLKLQQSGQDGKLTDGGLYTMLRRVKRTGTAKPPFYDQVEVRHNVHELQSMYLRIIGMVEDILRVRDALDAGADPRMVAYPTPTKDCKWDCDFFPVCPMFDDGSNAEGMLDSLYAHVDPYQRYSDEEAGVA